jgi:hypothetical protein
MRSLRGFLVSTAILAITFCGDYAGPTPRGAGTAAQRESLFDYILERTQEREAFSPVKNARLELDPMEAMRSLRDEVIEADTEEKLFYALEKVSNARKDRHLEVGLVPGGITLPDPAGVEMETELGPPSSVLQAPVRFAQDYGAPGRFAIFVTDHSTNDAHFANGPRPALGDRVLSVNSLSADEYHRAAEPYHRYSTVEKLRWVMAEALPQRTRILPGSFYGETLNLELEGADGDRYTVSLPYLHPDSIPWAEVAEPHYPDFREVFSTPTYDLLLPDDGRPVVLLRWYGFRETLIEDVDRLMAHASAEGLLEHDLIVDATRSGGGSRGAYALQRLTPRSFRTTFGNLRISDVTDAFITQAREEYRQRSLLDAGVPETVDDGTWLMEWLESDVTDSLRAGAAYTNNVPFKLAHAPRESDGVLDPTPVHFQGGLVLLLGPHGGSHLDQFAAIVADNKLGTLIGMPAGGYSNTWEWEEVLRFPGTDRPVVKFMWSIGHTIRPNGEILEGNPAQVDVFVPLTRENFRDYYAILMRKALEILGRE